ncbi:hypothetical protein [Nocardia sp. NPDC052566]|uniref:hypothetical protein n=1 Tax=Nocardia sp. NPDC052566 TaxID=3364330 RepID=UPI0037CBC5DE
MGWLEKLAEALGVRLGVNDSQYRHITEAPDDRLPEVVQAAERFAAELEQRWEALPMEFKKWDEQVEGRTPERHPDHDSPMDL